MQVDKVNLISGKCSVIKLHGNNSFRGLSGRREEKGEIIIEMDDSLSGGQRATAAPLRGPHFI